jgi:hypothetical protein
MPVAAQPDAAKVLQRRFGNQGTQALLRARSRGAERASSAVEEARFAIGGRPGQATLQTSSRGAISQPGDALEREAERTADEVMRMPQPSAPVEREHASVLQRSAAGAAVHETIPPIVHEVLRSPGRPLDGSTRAFMEPRFGQDFSGVRVHTGEHAADAASSIDARAFTSNRNVVFGAGEYAPQTEAGRRLLAHELTHVVQQGTGRIQRQTTQATEKQDLNPKPGTPEYLEKVETEMSRVKATWEAVFDKQHEAIEKVEKEVDKSNQPDVVQQTMMNVGLVLLGAALGGVGGLVTGTVGPALVGIFTNRVGTAVGAAAATSIAMIWIDATTNVAVQAGTRALTSKVNALLGPGSTSAFVFFQSQRDALARAKIEAMITAEAEGRRIRLLSNPLEIAQGMAAALDNVLNDALMLHAQKTAEAWFTYAAQVERGTVKDDKSQTPGTELDPASDSFWGKTPGVLYLTVNYNGDLESADLKGSTPFLIARIHNTPIHDLRMPKIITVSWIGEDLSLRINETGLMWLPLTSQRAGRAFWLSNCPGLQPFTGPTPSGSYSRYIGTDAQMWDGARTFAAGIGGKKLAGFLKD